MKHFQTQEETEELQGFQVQELAKVKHMVRRWGFSIINQTTFLLQIECILCVVTHHMIYFGVMCVALAHHTFGLIPSLLDLLNLLM